MCNSNAPKGENFGLGGRIVHAEVSSFRIETGSERGNLTIIVRVEVPAERRALGRATRFFINEVRGGLGAY
jgi:hypothetical protein